MKNIYTWAAKPAKRTLTVGDLKASKGKRKFTQVTANNVEEAEAAEKAGADKALAKRSTSTARKSKAIDQWPPEKLQTPREHHRSQHLPDGVGIHTLLCQQRGQGDGGKTPRNALGEIQRGHHHEPLIGAVGSFNFVSGEIQREAPHRAKTGLKLALLCFDTSASIPVVKGTGVDHSDHARFSSRYLTRQNSCCSEGSAPSKVVFVTSASLTVSTLYHVASLLGERQRFR